MAGKMSNREEVRYVGKLVLPIIEIVVNCCLQATNVLFLSGLERPAQLALDWRAGNLYYSR